MFTIFEFSANFLRNYTLEIISVFLFGLGYNLFKSNPSFSKNLNEARLKTQKNHSNFPNKKFPENLEKIKSIDEFNKILQEEPERFTEPQEILNFLSIKNIFANTETFNLLLISCFVNKKYEIGFNLINEINIDYNFISPDIESLRILVKGIGAYFCEKKNQVENLEKGKLIIFDFHKKISEILKFFEEKFSIKPDLIVYNYILESLQDRNESEDLWEYFSRNFNIGKDSKILEYLSSSELKNNPEPDGYTYLIILKSFKSYFISENQENISEVIQNLDEPAERFLFIADSLCKIKDYKLDENTYNIIIELSIKFHKYTQAGFYFKKLLHLYNNKINEKSYRNMIKAFSSINRLDKCIEIFYFLKTQKKILSENHEKENLFNTNHLINPYASNQLNYLNFEKLKKNNSSKNYFSQSEINLVYITPTPSNVTYSCIIQACIECHEFSKSEEFLNEMDLLNIEKNEDFYAVLINSYIKVKEYNKAFNLYDNLINFLDMKNFSFQLTANNKAIQNTTHKYFDLSFQEFITDKTEDLLNINLFNNILEASLISERFGKLLDIYNFLEKYSQKKDSKYNLKPDILTYTYFIKGFSYSNNTKKVIEIYENILKNKKEFSLNSEIFNTILDLMARNKDYEGMITIYSDMKNYGYKNTELTYAILIKYFVNINDLENARELYEDLISKGIKPNITIYQHMFTVYSQQNLFTECLELFEDLKRSKINPEKIIFEKVLEICFQNLDLKYAINVLRESIEMRVLLNKENYEILLENLIEYEEKNFENYLNKKICLNLQERIEGINIIKSAFKKLDFRLNKNLFLKMQMFLNMQKSFKKNQLTGTNTEYLKDGDVISELSDVVYQRKMSIRKDSNFECELDLSTKQKHFYPIENNNANKNFCKNKNKKSLNTNNNKMNNYY